ncbi:triose-phosphate isomerase family protein [Zhihengliuella flava]|uniref:Triosephosphate isomerase n=1 Tax=Zhihengliuella flava TaxID=1285193 RepID=A0A931DAI1_9MICC|nr:triose-phosphate isomerase family protein [Zhihengliuella flava]MBG6085018.1 triosephosphate isomerase [Zhihengliuella flava]
MPDQPQAAAGPRRSTQRYIGVSTKAYLGYAQSLTWLEGVRAQFEARQDNDGAVGVTGFVAPSFPVLESAARILKGTGVWLGAQDVGLLAGPTASGAATGEVPPRMLAELGVRILEVGHAERRAHFGEDEAAVAAKLRAGVANFMTPLLCIGESRRADPDDAVAACLAQVASALGLTEGAAGTPSPAEAAPIDPADVIFAYEPVWAIGAEQPADADYVAAVLTGLRARLDACSSGPVRLLYGGSAGPGLLPRLPAADGLFLGRFAHDPANLGRVLDEAAAVTAAS